MESENMVSVFCDKCGKEIYESNSKLHKGKRYCKDCHYHIIHDDRNELLARAFAFSKSENIDDKYYDDKLTKEIRKNLYRKVKVKRHE